MNLVLLAPEIQERLVTGELQVSERRLREATFETVWEEQENHLRA